MLSDLLCYGILNQGGNILVIFLDCRHESQFVAFTNIIYKGIQLFNFYKFNVSLKIRNVVR